MRLFRSLNDMFLFQMNSHDADCAEATSPPDNPESSPTYQPSQKELIIREKQALQKERYNQLLDLMHKSDLFVKMIFQRMEEANKTADKKIRLIRKHEVSVNVKFQVSHLSLIILSSLWNTRHFSKI